MRNKLFLLAVLVIAGLFVFAIAARPDRSVAQGEALAIRLEAGTFYPGKEALPAVDASLAGTEAADRQRGYYIVQFVGPVQEAWKEAAAAAGAELLGYIPDFAFQARMTPEQAAAVARLDSVNWVGIFQPAYKISQAIDLQADEPQLLRVRIAPGINASLPAADVARTGAALLRRANDVLIVAATGSQVRGIANVLDISWIEPFRLNETLNEYGAGAIMQANVANANGYDGSTQIVAVADTGLGGGTAATAHPDIPSSRITAVYNLTGPSDSCVTVVDDGAVDVDSGHGTHVAVSVLGDGDGSGIGKGTAPAAGLVFQAVEDYAQFKGLCRLYYTNGYYLISLPSDIRDLFQQAYSAGARIHSNSWGSAVAGDYTVDSANADDFVWNNRDMTITFSAGNDGVDANGNGVIDDDSTGSPATAKNVITVGASENDRQGNWNCDASLGYTTCTGQNTIFTYGDAWPSDYPANPIAGDPSAGNAQQMAAFSSRGPTDDGRIKPDVVAPGTWVLSGYSDLYQQGYDGATNPQNGAWQYDGWGFPYNQAYKYMGGTSMSNPLTAGAAAVVRDYYQKAHNHAASAALVKATLINSAVDMLDENNDGANDNDFPIPNSHEGWGLVNLANATDGSALFYDNSGGLATNATATYQISAPGGSPLKVSLVWSDYPSTDAASKNLVNDLDLTVSNGSTTYRANVFSGGWSIAGGSADRTNNVENVYIQSAANGTWTVTVTGYNVPNGPQPFALVIDGGGTGENPTPTPGPTNTPTPGPTATNTPVPTATNTPAPSAEMHVGDLDGSTLVYRNGRWDATVTVTVHDSSETAVANATVSGTWAGSGGTSCTTGANGQCSMTLRRVDKNTTSVSFTVDSVTHATNIYNAGANHDPDGDSNGTTITIAR